MLDIRKYVSESCISFIIGFILGGCIAYCSKPTRVIKEQITVPIPVNTDSIIRVNDSIKILINNLDSIKNAKIIEVKMLDNDSTLNLFYELIRK